MNIIPVMICKNEEIWIERVLTPFSNIFPHVIVTDTGSSDGTIAQIAKVKNIHLMSYGKSLSPAEVGLARGWMQSEAKEHFGATHVFLVDGDELYPTKYLQWIYDNPMPDNAMGGFTYGVECTELENGECWMYGVGVSRHAVFSVDSKWHGVYPFESPDSFIAGDPTNYYWQSLDPSYHFYHIHQMRRSSRDEDVHLRMEKKYHFSMQSHPEIKPEKFWLKNQEDYQEANMAKKNKIIGVIIGEREGVRVPYIVPPPEPPTPGDDVMLSATKILNNDEIINSPDVTVEAIAAPSANQLIFVHSVCVEAKIATDGGYTGISTPSYIGVVYEDSIAPIWRVDADDACLLACFDPSYIVQLSQYAPALIGAGKSIHIISINAGGVFGGGNAANTLTVTIFYTIIDL